MNSVLLAFVGITAGAVASTAQLGITLWRAELALKGRTMLATLAYPLGLCVLAGIVVAGLKVLALPVWSLLVGIVGARFLILRRVRGGS